MPLRHLGGDEGQQLGIDGVGMGRAHAVWQMRENLQRAVLQQLGGQERGIGDGYDLIVGAMEDQRRDGDVFEILGKVGFRERLDAIVMGIGGAHHALTPPVPDDGLGRFHAGSVEAVERTAREIEVELRAIGGELFAKIVEDLDRQAARIRGRLKHQWRYSAYQDQPGDPILAVACDVTGRFAATGRMTDVDGITKIEMLGYRRHVGSVVIHVMAIAHLRRSAMPAAIVGDDTVTLPDKEEHLIVPIVGAEWPAVMEDNWLRRFRTPVFVEELNSVLSVDRDHRIVSCCHVG